MALQLAVHQGEVVSLARVPFESDLRYSYEVVDEDFEKLRGHGFTAEDIWDIAAVSALFALSNRMANFTSMRPNEEFYLLGRVPK